MTGNRAVFAALCILACSLPAAAQKPTFVQIASQEVRVDVLVTAEGKPLDGLSASDFEIYDSGVQQKIEYAKMQQDMPLEAILIFDMSRSVVGRLLDNLKNAARELLTDFRDEDRAELVLFNHAVVYGSPMTVDLDRIREALERMQPAGNSSLIDASYAGLVLAENGSGLPLIIIFSDGLDTSSWLSGDEVLETAKHNDSVVYGISTQIHQGKTFLSDLTELTGGMLFEVEDDRRLTDIFLGILREFRKRYVLSYRPQGVGETGWHKLEVRVGIPSAEVHTRPGYMRTSPEQP
jgi:Ca-activated chloride channel family protein